MIILGVQKLPDRAQGLVQKFTVALMFADFLFFLSSTFYVLFVIDTVGYTQLGCLLAARFLLQALLDYPSGVLGDWIGQKWVLFIAYLTLGLSYAVLYWANSFSSLLVVYLLYGFASSQESGAWNAWFDNNYKVVADEPDPNRETYKFFFGRFRATMNLVGAIAFVIGGIATTIYFRQDIFAVQAVGMFGVALVVLIVINDFAEVERPKKALREYFKLLEEGLRIVAFNRVLLFLMIGICCYGVVWAIWAEMILFPLYFGYTGTDAGASVLRFIAWIIGIPVLYFAANFATRLNIKWYPRVYFIFSVLFFSSFMLLTAWIPPEDEFEPIAFVLTIAILGSIIMLLYIAEILERRLFLDLIPDRNRSSVYSLRPTLVLLVRAPGVVIGGLLLTNLGISQTVGILGLLGILATVFFYIAIRLLPGEALKRSFLATN